MEKKVILHLCADIGSDSKPYKDAGYEVILVGKSIGVENYHPPKKVYGIIANPVCTEFSIAPGFHTRRNLANGLFLVNECLRVIKEAKENNDLTFWVIENPASGRLKEFLGEPTLVYQPWEYGSPWTKKTALWGKFNIPKKLYHRWRDVPKNDKLYVRPNRPKPSITFLHKSAIVDIPEFKDFKVEDDTSFRSLCSQNFAKEFFKVNL